MAEKAMVHDPITTETILVMIDSTRGLREVYMAFTMACSRMPSEIFR